MTENEIRELVGKLIFRPGWRLSVRDNYTTPYAVEIMFHIDTVDTSYQTRDGRYDVPKHFDTGFVITDARQYTPETLMRAIIDKAHEFDVHEDQELLRVRQPDGTWKAPFHPHRAEGMLAWELTSIMRGDRTNGSLVQTLLESIAAGG